MQKLIAPLMSHLVGGRIKNTVKQIRIRTICYGIIGISLFMALIFLCVMGFIALCLVVEPLVAASIMFFIWLFIAGLGVLLGHVFRTYQRYAHQKQLEEQRHQLMTASTLSGIAMLGQNLPFTKLGVPILGLVAYLLWQKDKKDPS
ncbi:phage holin family protein [Bartonella sp. A05]|uniref:phage holin family protein n=1 Tax=Bartonella sp. A05 TaxID=2967261 RepID=UPI0022A9CDFE|nr:phage holin family protein [Bartonella sp. A05]MCZ2203676.1 phage holin family protein [Bartonella sp. A05]